MRSHEKRQSHLEEEGERSEKGTSNNTSTGHERLDSGVGLGGRGTSRAGGGRNVDIVKARVGAPNVLLTKGGKISLSKRSKSLRGVETGLDEDLLTTSTDNVDIVGGVEEGIACKREGPGAAPVMLVWGMSASSTSVLV